MDSNIWPTTFDITIWLDQLWVGIMIGSVESAAKAGEAASARVAALRSNLVVLCIIFDPCFTPTQ